MRKNTAKKTNSTSIILQLARNFGFLTLFSFLYLQTSKAQTPRYNVSIISSYTLPNSSEFSYISDVSCGIDAAALWRILWISEDSVSQGYRLQRNPFYMGIRVNATYFPNEIAGHRVGLAGVLQESIIHNKQNDLRWEIDFGLAAYTKPYRQTHDTSNAFIGSYINCLLHAGLSYIHRFNNNSCISISGKWAHSSNGYLKKPNKGLNYIQIELGYSLPHNYIVSNSLPEYDILWKSDIVEGYPFIDGWISYAPGVVQSRIKQAKHNYYYAHTAQMGFFYRLSQSRALGANVDLTYNYSHEEFMAEHGNYSLPFYVGLLANYEASWNRLDFRVGVGAYLLRSDLQNAPIYERLGLFYNFGNPNKSVRHFVGIAMKAHYAHIDFIEWHYGVKLMKNRTRRESPLVQ